MSDSSRHLLRDIGCSSRDDDLFAGHVHRKQYEYTNDNNESTQTLHLSTHQGVSRVSPRPSARPERERIRGHAPPPLRTIFRHGSPLMVALALHVAPTGQP